MKRQLLAILGIGVLFLPGAVKCSAQEPHHPQISIGHQGVDRLKSDLKTLLSLTSEKDQAQLQNLVDFVDLMAFGLDPKKPIRVDLLTGIMPMPYVVSAAYKNDPAFAAPGAGLPAFSDLLDNLNSNFVLQNAGADWREFLPPDQGWLRLLPDIKTAIMILTTPADHALLKQILQKMPAPLPAIAPLLQNDCGVGVQLINSAHTVEDQKKRAASFGEVRANRMDVLQKRPTESVTEFNLRKGLVSNHLKELERLMVEGNDLRARAFLNSETKSARILFTGDGIPGTGLAQSIQLFNQHEDAFASLAQAENSILSFRVNHPIDEFRQKISFDFIELLNEDVDARVAASENLSDDQKAAVRELHNGVMTVLKDSIASGNVNAFVESWLNADEEFVAVGAISATNATRLDETLALIARTGKGNKVESAIEKVGDVTIHRIQLGKGFLKLLDRVFGEETAVLIATSNDTVWFATGPDALDVLKKTIGDLQDPADSDVVLRVEARLLPWVKHAQKVVDAAPEPTSVDDKRIRRDHRRDLARAVEALGTGEQDDVKFDVTVDDGMVSGEIFVNTGLLRFVGRQLSAFSKENFE
ncbi:MAG TPA: hypothetical protein EYG03_06950 [Planctomycetes bacterium]|nr:hypothetical protein [Fuerstiella sp.]HIK91703.1 hypothetical protein [Planctomycetota bacterium]